MEVLQWSRENGCSWNVHTWDAAFAAGQFEVLKWARENDCPSHRVQDLPINFMDHISWMPKARIMYPGDECEGHLDKLKRVIVDGSFLKETQRCGRCFAKFNGNSAQCRVCGDTDRSMPDTADAIVMESCCERVMVIFNGPRGAIENGPTITQVTAALSGRFTEAQVREAVEYLANEGHLYSTIDDDHYRSTSLEVTTSLDDFAAAQARAMGSCSQQVMVIFNSPRGASEYGPTITQVTAALSGRFTEAQVREAVESLVDEGHLYSTIDDDHYRSTFSTFYEEDGSAAVPASDIGSCSQQVMVIFNGPWGASEDDLTITQVTAALSGRFNEAQVREAVESLVDEGHLYCTIDDHHYCSTLL